VSNLPLIVFGVFSVVGGCLAIPLPETRHRPLATTIEDIENYDEFCKKHTHLHENPEYSKVAADDDNNLVSDTKV